MDTWRNTFSDTPSRADVLAFAVDTKDHSSIRLRPYRIPIRWRDKLAEEIQTLLNLNIIRLSNSPWSSPVVCMWKPGGEIRMCIDFQALNKVTTDDVYPLPRIDELLDRVAKSKHITTLDLLKGYYQVPLQEDAIPKTVFMTPQGKFKFLTLPLGLFQRLMDNVLQGSPNTLAYIDNIVI